jgi:hypothetical protein
MALQSSGQIKFSELNTELSRTSTDLISLSDAAQGVYGAINTNNAVADRPDSSEPHSISEWYSYNHNAAGAYTNTHYYNMTYDGLRRSATSSPFNLSASQDLSVSIWVNQLSTTANEIMWDFSNTSSNSANRFFLQYHKSLNRLVVRHRTSGVNYDRQWALHSNNSVTGTGTNSGVAWSNTNRGNVNGDNWSMLTVTYDASQANSLNGLKLYWNATELTSSAANNSGTRSTSAVNDFTIGNNNHNSTTTAGAMNCNIDEIKVFGSVLSASNVTSLYNGGVVANAANSYSTGLLTEYSFDSNTQDSAGLFPTSQRDTGTRTSY